MTLNASATQQFRATVAGANNTGVTWSATGGIVTASGLYTAPATAGTYRVTAKSAADTSKSASATITVAAQAVAVTISPTSVSLPTGGTQQFTATVTGTTNTSVTWSGTGGTITTAGLYTAPSSPGTYTLTATSVVDTTKSASVSVTVTSSSTINGLVAAYSFDEGTSTTLTDFSGNKLNGKINNATWTTSGRYGNALQFNGSNSYVDLGNPYQLQLTGSMTLEAWVKAAANPADDGQIVAKSDSYGWQLKTSPDTGPQTFGVAVSASGSSSHTQRYSKTVRSLGTWCHVAGVYDAASGTLTTYVNGVPDNGTLVGTIPRSQFNQNVNVNIGRRTGGFYFNGIIDELRIYNRVLTQAEIQTDLNTPVGNVAVPAPAPVTISITPASATLVAGGIQQFTTTVTGTSNTAVTWSGTGGSITTSGLYTAPSTAGTYQLTATSVADTSKSASATITVTAQPPQVAISISPTSATLQTGKTQQFAASVTGSSNTSVTWSASGGTVSSAGLYTAPSTAGTYTVTATSVADTTKKASATVAVTAAASVAISISPANATLSTGGTQQYTATVTGSTNTSVTWSASSGSISSSGMYTAPATPGSYTVTARSVADATKSASATVTVSGTQLLTASPTTIAFGNVLLGNSSAQAITLTNTGSGSVTITAANVAGGVFNVSGLSLPLTLAAGASKSASVNFAPDISGTSSGSVSFVSNATNSPATVSLSGTGVAQQQHSVDLTWVGSTSNGVIGYYIYRSTVSGSSYSRLNATAESSTTYTDSTVTSGKTYYYVVTAVDGAGNESAYSNQSTAVIPTP